MVKRIGLALAIMRSETIARSMELMRIGASLGFSEVWSGLSLSVLDTVKEVAKLSNELGYYYFVDVHPQVFRELGASPSDLKVFSKIGVHGIRVDWGFNTEQIAEMANNDLGIKVELNASVFPVDELDRLLKMVKDPERLLASHDWYPIPYTGLSLEMALEKSKAFHERGIPVGIFISTKGGERTTVEYLRNLDIGVSASILVNSRYIDRILIGDPTPTEDDLRKVAEARVKTKIRVIAYRGLTIEEAKAFNREYWDVRVKEATVGLTAPGANGIKPRNTTRRFRGAVTVLNTMHDYIQVWIFKRDAPPDPRFNVIGEVVEEDMEIVERLAERTRGVFSMKETDLPPVVLEAVNINEVLEANP